MTTLPCGCTRGEFLCPTAVALWQRCNVAWRDDDDDEKYYRLRELYEAHFEQPAKEPANDKE